MPPKNILFCGGPGSGKTTVMNSTLKASVEINPDQRYVVIEKLMSEVQCRGNHVQQFISNHTVSVQECVEIAMVSRPDRIIVGEIKGAEALEMIKAWNTGTPGGMGTVHANTPLECFQRVADLCMEAGLSTAPWNQIIMTIDVIVWVGRQGSESGFIKEILFTKGSEHEETKFLEKSTLNVSKHSSGLLNTLVGGVLMLASSSAFASSSSSSFPVVSVIKSIADAISGPVAFSVATILICAVGLMNAFGEWGDGIKKLINVAFWMAIVFGVVGLIALFGGSGAVV